MNADPARRADPDLLDAFWWFLHAAYDALNTVAALAARFGVPLPAKLAALTMTWELHEHFMQYLPSPDPRAWSPPQGTDTTENPEMDRRALFGWLATLLGAQPVELLTAWLGAHPDHEAVEIAHRVTQHYRAQAAKEPARQVYEGLRRHVAVLDTLARHASDPRHRQAILRAAAEARGHAAAIAAVDLARFAAAGALLTEALRQAREADSPELAAWLYDKAAQRAIYAELPQHARLAVEVAIAEGRGRIPASILVELHLHWAEALALTGDGRALEGIERAAGVVARAHNQPAWTHLGYQDMGRVLTYEGGCRVLLGQYEEAEQAARRALATCEPGHQRRAWILLDLVEVYRVQGEPEQAARALREALAISRHVGSVERLGRARRAAQRLEADYPQVAEVRELAEEVRKAQAVSDPRSPR